MDNLLNSFATTLKWYEKINFEPCNFNCKKENCKYNLAVFDRHYVTERRNKKREIYTVCASI